MCGYEISVEIKSSDLKRMVYWIICKFKVDNFHHQSSSVKRDSIGGFIDRWLNRSPEYLIFNELIREKEYDVVIDNFLYNQDTEKNSPDVIGIKNDDGKLIRFTYFDDGKWKQEENMPYIEVKTFKEDQALVTIKEEDMGEDNQYYVIVESHLTKDYITALFSDSLFSDEIYELMEVNEAFIESDSNGNIIDPERLAPCEDLGKYKLLGIFTEDEIKRYSIKVALIGEEGSEKPEIPRYFHSIQNIFDIKSESILCPENICEGDYQYTYPERDYAPFNVNFLENDSKLTLIMRNANDMVLKVQGNVKLKGSGSRGNIVELNSGYFKVRFNRRADSKRHITSEKPMGPYNFEEIEEGVYRYQKDDTQYVPFNIEFIEEDSKVFILNKAVGYLDVKVKGKVKFNSYTKENGCFRIKMKRFERSSKSTEYIIDKYIIRKITEDVTADLINCLDGIWDNTV